MKILIIVKLNKISSTLIYYNTIYHFYKVDIKRKVEGDKLFQV